MTQIILLLLSHSHIIDLTIGYIRTTMGLLRKLTLPESITIETEKIYRVYQTKNQEYYIHIELSPLEKEPIEGKQAHIKILLKSPNEDLQHIKEMSVKDIEMISQNNVIIHLDRYVVYCNEEPFLLIKREKYYLIDVTIYAIKHLKAFFY